MKSPSANSGNARDVGLIPGLGRSPGVGNGNPLQYSCLENPMNRGTYSSWGSQSIRHSWMAEPKGREWQLVCLVCRSLIKGNCKQRSVLTAWICEPAFVPQSHFYDIILDFKLTLHWGSWEGIGKCIRHVGQIIYKSWPQYKEWWF